MCCPSCVQRLVGVSVRKQSPSCRWRTARNP
nr:MAG TPA: hypothetical protein [Caudoviricetes sp.]